MFKPKLGSYVLFLSLASATISNSSFAIESSVLRTQKNTFILAEGGYAVAPILSKGVRVGMNLTRDLSWEFSYAEGHRNVEYADLYAKMYAVHLKKFWTNSFYTSGGVGYRVVMDRTTASVSEAFYVERRGRSAGIDLSVGNRWQFDSVNFGIDWLGWFHPLTVNRNEHFVMANPAAMGAHGAPTGDEGGGNPHGGAAAGRGKGGHGQGGASHDPHQTDWDRLSKYGTLQLLRVTAGVSF